MQRYTKLQKVKILMSFLRKVKFYTADLVDKEGKLQGSVYTQGVFDYPNEAYNKLRREKGSLNLHLVNFRRVH